MSQPRALEHDDDQLERYLLGLLPADRAERLDEAAMADDEMAARLRVVENDLVDAYVRGDLSGERLERFESHYLLSPRRRRMVTFARGFVRAVDAPAGAADAGGPGAPGIGTEDLPAASAPEVPAPAIPAPATRRSRLTVPLLALAALLVAACGLLYVQASQLRTGLDDAKTQTTALEQRTRTLQQQLADSRAANEKVAAELERVRAALPPAAPAPGTKLPSPADALPAALILLPQTRAAGAIPTLKVPAQIERVPIELRLDSNDFAQYESGLKDPATGQLIWNSGWLTATPGLTRRTVRLAVPASLLKPQHYALDLSGRDASGRVEVIGSYAFQVIAP